MFKSKPMVLGFGCAQPCFLGKVPKALPIAWFSPKIVVVGLFTTLGCVVKNSRNRRIGRHLHHKPGQARPWCLWWSLARILPRLRPDPFSASGQPAVQQPGKAEPGSSPAQSPPEPHTRFRGDGPTVDFHCEQLTSHLQTLLSAPCGHTPDSFHRQRLQTSHLQQPAAGMEPAEGSWLLRHPGDIGFHETRQTSR